MQSRGQEAMQAFGAIAERRIREAQERGEFNDLPGMGLPLTLDDDSMVPEDLRVAYRLLKNAGFVPPELAAHGEIRKLEQLLQAAETDDERRRLLSRLNFLLTRTAAGRRRAHLEVDADYFEQIVDRLSHR